MIPEIVMFEGKVFLVKAKQIGPEEQDWFESNYIQNVETGSCQWVNTCLLSSDFPFIFKSISSFVEALEHVAIYPDSFVFRYGSRYGLVDELLASNHLLKDTYRRLG